MNALYRAVKHPTARFWIWHEGSPVKLSLGDLKPMGDEVHLYTSQRHEEGYTARAVTYSFDGESLTEDIYEHGRDCDGQSSYSATYSARLVELQIVACQIAYLEPVNIGLRYPIWNEESTQRRDYSAEAAGY